MLLLLGLLLTHSNLTVASPAPPDTLTARETRNLTALARAVGDLKYFYPNRHTARVSWETVLTRAIPAVRHAPTDQALAATLDRLLRPLAPGCRLAIGTGTAILPAPPAAAGFYWEHRGLGLDKAGLGLVTGLMRLGGLHYESRIEAVSATETAAAFPDGPTYTEALTDSVHLTLPLVLTAAQHRLRLRYRPGRRVRQLSAATPEQRMATVMLTWNIIRHFYPYQAVLDRAGWTEALPAALEQAGRATTETELLAAVRRLLARLPDRHLSFSPLTRTGLHLTAPPLALELAWADSAVVVHRVPAGLASAVAPGAVLTHLNGQPAGPLLEALRRTIPATSPTVARQLAARQLLPELAATAASAAFTLRDSLGRTRTQTWAFRQLRGSHSEPLGPVREVAPGIVYLDATRLRYADFRRALPQLQAAGALVVDVRRRPHYDLLRILPHFTAEPLLSDSIATPLLHQPNFGHPGWLATASSPILPQLPLLTAPKVFLTGPDTYSYGETVATLVRNNRLGVLLGQATGGTNGEMNFVSIGRAYELTFTGRRVLPQGEVYQGRGLTPDLPVMPTPSPIGRPLDATLQQAIEWLRAQ
ncbi:S41 family peptidase [Hymenobacter rubripertinctus]|uniref:Tail specific protease domain-containing protein n=1 Tax=Hymenobacter rubripertinctus TaxID=2029981 RepID=A0A418QM58_9BACT|nr:S41 family peptidase [Hymenobacter rubripertinctus]RIY06231.1 hypothetical protein D0T11_19065 [Hymenobacter rubripertinctus]